MDYQNLRYPTASIEQTIKKFIILSYENVSRMQDSSCIALIKWRHGSGFVSASV